MYMSRSPTPSTALAQSPFAIKRRGAPLHLRWWLWSVGLTLGVASSPTWSGPWLLKHLHKGILDPTVFRAQHLGGWLWAPYVSDSELNWGGIQLQSEHLQLHLNHINPLSKTIYIGIELRQNNINVDLQQLIAQLQKATDAQTESWKFIVSELKISGSTLQVNGKTSHFPDLNVSVQSISNIQEVQEGTRKSAHKTLLLSGKAAHETFSARIKVDHTTQGATQGNIYTTEFNTSARILNMYWNGITDGTLHGHYVVGDGPIRGNLQIEDGSIHVPNADFVGISHISGKWKQRDNDITLLLHGHGWQGPVQFLGSADLQSETWKASAQALPTFAGLGDALQTEGSQQIMQLKASAQGRWGNNGFTRVKAYGRGSGKIFGLDFEGSHAYYLFESHATHTEALHNTLNFETQTRIAGDQTLRGRWHFGKTGQLSWKGQLGKKPLQLTGTLASVPSSVPAQPQTSPTQVRTDTDAADATDTQLTFSGHGLGGPASGRYWLGSKIVKATLNPDYGFMNANMKVSGYFHQLQADIQRGQMGPFALKGTAEWSRHGLRAELHGPNIRRFWLDTNTQLDGTWKATEMQLTQLGGLGLTGRGQINLLTGEVRGQNTLKANWLDQPLDGALRLNYLDQRGHWQTHTQQPTDQSADDLKPTDLKPSDLKLTWNKTLFGLKSERLHVLGGVNVQTELHTQLANTPSIPNTPNVPKVFGHLRARHPNGYHLRAQASGNVTQLSMQSDDWQQLNTSGTLDPRQTFPLQLQFTQLDKLTQKTAHVASAKHQLRLNASWSAGSDESSGSNRRSGLHFELFSRSGQKQARATGYLGGAAEANTDKSVPDWKNWHASGEVQLGAVAALFRQTASGTARLNLHGHRGSVDLSGDYTHKPALESAESTESVAEPVQIQGKIRFQGQLFRSSTSSNGVASVASGSTANGAQSNSFSALENVLGTWSSRLQFTYKPEHHVLPTQLQEAHVTGQLNGTLYPQPRIFGPLTFLYKSQHLRGSTHGKIHGQMQLFGSYQKPQARFQGRSNALNVVGVHLPAQPLSFHVHLASKSAGAARAPVVSGTWGKLHLNYQEQQLRFSGSQQLHILGENANLQLSGLWAPDFTGHFEGNLQFSGQFDEQTGRLGGYQLQAKGPWQALDLQLQRTQHQHTQHASQLLNLQGRGLLNLPELRYQADIHGPISWAGQRWELKSEVTGQGATPHIRLAAHGSDAQGHIQNRLKMQLHDLSNFTLQGQGHLFAQDWRANLRAKGGLLSGTLKSSLLRLIAKKGVLEGKSEVAGHRLNATTHLNLPSGFDLTKMQLEHTQLRLDGPYASAQISGRTHRGQPLRGTMRLKPQRLGNVATGLYVPQQTFPLQLNLNADQNSPHLRPHFQIGELRYLFGQGWGGSLSVPYHVHTPNKQTHSGRLHLRGQRSQLSAQSTGLLQAQIALLPNFSGTILTDPAKFLPVSPMISEQLRNQQLQLGRLKADINSTGLRWRSLNARYAQKALTTRGIVSWQDGFKPDELKVQGQFTFSDSRLSFFTKNNAVHLKNTELAASDLLDIALLQRPQEPQKSAVGHGQYSQHLEDLKHGKAVLSGYIPLDHWQHGELRAHFNFGKLPNSGQSLEQSLQSSKENAGKNDQPKQPPKQPSQLSGTARWQANALHIDTRGSWQTHHASIAGQVWPQTRLNWFYRDSHGHLRGTASHQNTRHALQVNAQGPYLSSYLKHPIELTAKLPWPLVSESLASEPLAPANPTKDVHLDVRSGRTRLQLLARTTQNAAQNAKEQAWQTWPLEGTLQAPDLQDLQALSDQDGFLSARLGGTLGSPQAQISGELLNVPLNAKLNYAATTQQLSIAQADVTLPNQLGTAQLQGEIWPSLQATVRSRLKHDLGEYTGKISGSFDQPKVRVQGTLDLAEIQQNTGLYLSPALAPKPTSNNHTQKGQIKASLDGKKWSFNLNTPTLEAQGHGRLTNEEEVNHTQGNKAKTAFSKLGLQALGVAFHGTRYQRPHQQQQEPNSPTYNPTYDLQTHGNLHWNPLEGWRGKTDVQGIFAGQPTKATLQGQHTLQATATLKQREQLGTLFATLPATLPFEPAGHVRIHNVDLGTLWNKPNELRLSATGQLGGTWQAPEAQIHGQLQDTAHEITGTLRGQWQADHAQLSLHGPKLQATFQFRRDQLQGQYTAHLNTKNLTTPLHIARFLPTETGFSALDLSGRASVQGSFESGIQQLHLEHLRLSGQHATAGHFGLSGSAYYQPTQQKLGGKLYGHLGQGWLKLNGQFPEQVHLQAVGLRWNDTEANADVRLSGHIANPANLNLAGHVDLEHPQISVRTQLGGRLNNPTLWSSLQPKQHGLSGKLYLQASRLNWREKTAQTHLYGSLGHANSQAKANVDLQGQWPRLRGSINLRHAEQKYTVLGRGNGVYDLDLNKLGQGNITLTHDDQTDSNPQERAWLPKLSGSLDLTPLALVAQDTISGEARVSTLLSGSILRPKLAGSFQSSDLKMLKVSNSSIPALSGTFGWSSPPTASKPQQGLHGLYGQIMQRRSTTSMTTQPVGQLSSTGVKLSDLTIKALNTPVQVSGEVRFPWATANTANTAHTANDWTAHLNAKTTQAPAEPSHTGHTRGNIELKYRAQTGFLSLNGYVAQRNYQAKLALWANRLAGWHGSIKLSDTSGISDTAAKSIQGNQSRKNTPATQILNKPAQLKIGGQYLRPFVSGDIELFGTKTHVFAQQSGVQLRLHDGPEIKASGLLGLKQDPELGWRWYGAARFDHPFFKATLAPNGPLSRPEAILTLRREGWSANGSIGLQQAHLNVSDGQNGGDIRWNGQEWHANLVDLDLTQLKIPNLTGQLSATGFFGTPHTQQTAIPDQNNTPINTQINTQTNSSPDGLIRFELKNFKSKQTVPYLNLPLSGDLRGQLKLKRGRWKMLTSASLEQGLLSVQSEQTSTGWNTTLRGSLRKKIASQAANSAQNQNDQNRSGLLTLNLQSKGQGLFGEIQASQYPISLHNEDKREATHSDSDTSDTPSKLNSSELLLSGQVALDGQNVQGELLAQHPLGLASLRLSDGFSDMLTDLLPTNVTPYLKTTQQFLGLKPQGNYKLETNINHIQLDQLTTDDLKGQLSGRLRLQSGGGTFSVLFHDIASANHNKRPLQGQIRGTKLGDDWGLGGYFGSSEFTGRLQKGVVSMQADLRAFPIDMLVSVIAGKLPGTGSLSGIARARFPLVDPSSGSATIVAERVNVSSETHDTKGNKQHESLQGHGLLVLNDRQIKMLKLKLSGSGTWDVNGQYTHDKVDLNATFDNTTFTPVLRLLPPLTPWNPALQGTLTLKVGGSYDEPTASLQGDQLRGELAGNTLHLPRLNVHLPSSGLITGQATLNSKGTFGAQGTLDLQSQLSAARLSNSKLTFRGTLHPSSLGPLPNTTVQLSQHARNYTQTQTEQSTGSAGDSANSQKVKAKNTTDTWLLNMNSRSSAQDSPHQSAGILKASGSLSPEMHIAISARNYNLPLAFIYGKNNALTGHMQLDSVEQGLIRVQGNADFSALILGRPPTDTSTARITPNNDNNVKTGTDAPKPDAKRPLNPYQVTDENSPLPHAYLHFAKDAEKTNKDATPSVHRSFLERLWLDHIRLTVSGGVRIDENLARANLSSQGLTITGTGDAPNITGDFLVQRGNVFLRENEFRITEGYVHFDGLSAYPEFKMTAESLVPSATTAQDVPVQITLQGDFSKNSKGPMAGRQLTTHTIVTCLTEELNCRNPHNNAPYSEAELYALVMTGIPNLEQLPNNLQLLGASALQTTFNVFFLGEVERTLARAFGVDVLRLSPTFSGKDGLNAVFTVGSYLTKEIFVQYKTDFSGEGNIAARYKTPDGRFAFQLSTPIQHLDIQSLRPNFSAEYNFRRQTSLNIGLQIGNKKKDSVQYSHEGIVFQFGVVHRFGLDDVESTYPENPKNSTDSVTPELTKTTKDILLE